MIEIVPTLGRWPRAPLGELCDIRGGFPAPQDDAAFEDGEIPFVRMKDVGRHHFTNNLCETEQSLNRAHFEEGRYQLTPRGSILMPRSGSVALNHRAILTIDAVIVSHLCALVLTSDKITTDFLYRFLCLADMRKLTKKTTGLDSIAFSDLRLVAIPLPSLAEQRRIVEVLNRAEVLQFKRRASLAQLHSLTQSIFLDLFGNPATNLKRWPACTLGDALIAIRNGANAEQRNEPGGWPITRIETISDGTIDMERVRWIEPDDSLIENFQLQTGDILFSHINSVEHIGKTALYTGAPKTLIHGINLLRLRPNLDLVDPVWLLHLLKNDAVRTVFRTRCKRAVNQASLNQPDIKSLAISLPPLALQQDFARRVRAVEKLQAKHNASLVEMDALFAALQHRAFNGEL